ncbi:MAG: LPS assembly protein LptD [Mariprofundaceae bacterium]
MKQNLFFLCMLLPAIAQAQPIDISADHLERDGAGNIKASGGVEVIRGDETLKADELYYKPGEHRLEARGNVIFLTPDAEIRALAGELDTRDYIGVLHQAELLLPDGGRLSAERVSRVNALIYEVEHARFSACPPDSNAWELAAASAVLDQAKGTFTARGAKLKVAGLPILYAPYWQQVLRRQSGFLTPSFASSNRLGTELSAPYYWAPRPNWDMTINPHWMSARGLRPEVEMRHVSPVGRESFYGEWFYDQKVGRDRGHLTGEIDRQGPLGTRLIVEADHVSDRDYLADFTSNLGDASGHYLQSSATLAWQGDQLSMALSARHQQNLLAVSNAETAHVLPRFDSTFFQPLGASGAVIYLDQQTTRFQRRIGDDGWRLDLYPHLDFTRLFAGVSTHLRLGSHHTRYWLNDAAGTNRAAKRTSGEVSLETTAVFARINHNRRLRHSIEPTLRYDLIEVGEQSHLPNFDSAFGALTMGSLLSGNRFSGLDRIENSHRIALLLANRIQYKPEARASARTWLLARLGIAYNFRRELIDNSGQDLARPFSDLLGEVLIYPSSWLKLTGNFEYSPFERFWPIIQAGLDVSTGNRHSLSIDYRSTDGRFVSQEEHAATVAGRIQLASPWALTGAWHFDISRRTTQEARAGVAYSHACWNLDVQGYRINRPVGTGEATNIGVRFLLGLKGLGSVGS